MKVYEMTVMQLDFLLTECERLELGDYDIVKVLQADDGSVAIFKGLKMEKVS